MICVVRPKEVLPYQAAHWTCPACQKVFAICFECGPSSSRPAWEGGDTVAQGHPVYAALRLFVDAHLDRGHALVLVP